jgi:hypothetical protein
VGLNHEGKVVVAGSHGTPMVLDMLKQGIEEVNALEEPDEA